MCSTFLPRSRRTTRRPRSVNSLAAQPPEIPEPTTMASKVVSCVIPTNVGVGASGRQPGDLASSNSSGAQCVPHLRILGADQPYGIAAQLVFPYKLQFGHERAGVLEPHVPEDALFLPHGDRRLLDVIPARSDAW